MRLAAEDGRGTLVGSTRGHAVAGADGTRQGRTDGSQATVSTPTNPKIPESHDLADLLATLPAGRRRVVVALMASRALTYPQLAAALGVHLGTIHAHLRRVRQRHPELYALVMAERAHQLAARHQQALARAEAHSRAWHRKQANRRYYYRFGRWPWEPG